MRDRVWCDPVAGFSFRFPYDWICTDQTAGTLHRPNGEGATPIARLMGTRWQVVDGKPRYDLEPFSFPVNALPNGLAATATPTEVGEALAGGKLLWEDWDYYQPGVRRPFAAKGHAPAGITARLGRGPKRSCLAVKHGDRISGLVMNGAPDANGNLIPVTTFEVLVKSGQRLATWRELQCRKQQVQRSDGRFVPATATGNVKPVSWGEAWELETEHYHITANRDPARLANLGAYYEGLWRAYAKLFQPDAMPPLKAEVHVFEKIAEYEGAARHWVDPSFVCRKAGSMMSGFFSPHLLSLWVVEEVAAFTRNEVTVEGVSAHECTHQFVHLTCNGTRHVPTWINEGLAVYFESGVFRSGEFIPQLPQRRLEPLKATYKKREKPLRPLDAYLDHHDHIDAAEYAEVFAMTHFWVFSDQGAVNRPKGVKTGQERFVEYWKALKAKEDGAKAFERIFMADMIKSQGSREAAVKLWTKALMDYVANGLKVRR